MGWVLATILWSFVILAIGYSWGEHDGREAYRLMRKNNISPDGQESR